VTADNRLAVMDLIARYARAIDAGDVDGYASNFTEDGVIESSAGTFAGREEIRALLRRLVGSGRIGGQAARTRHFVGLPLIEGDDERCRAHTYVTIFTQEADGGAVAVPSVGSYEDVCVKRGNRWLFERRIIASDLGRFGR